MRSRKTFTVRAPVYAPGASALRSPTPSRLAGPQRLRLGVCALLGMVAIGVFSYLLAFHRVDASLKPGEIDLHGAWKLKLDDRAEYAQAALDDSAWCLITVPNAGIRAQGDANDHPAADCPRETYPKDKLRGATYWYRKRFEVPLGAHWATPSLFLGAVKDRAWIYLDGEFVGATAVEQSPAILLIDPARVAPGFHELALRVSSRQSQNPGIFHVYQKGVAIGDYAETSKGIAENVSLGIVEPVGFLAVQAVSLILCLLLLFRGRGQTDASLIWLASYFLAAFVESISYASPGLLLPNNEACWFFQFVGAAGMATGLMGFATKALFAPKIRELLNPVLAIYGVLVAAVLIVLYHLDRLGTPLAHSLDVGVTLIPFVTGILSLALTPKLRGFPGPAPKLNSRELLTLGLVTILHLCFSFERLFGNYFAIPVPLPGISASLTLLIALFSVDAFVLQQQELAFFGRFIRSGLRSLLTDGLRGGVHGQKLFRGRRIPAMKVDVVGHTDVTYGMPYGVKRLYQDLLFTHIDHAVSQYTFLDRSEGDGSIYFFLENIEGGSCAMALKVARDIRDVALRRFDEDFAKQLAAFVASTPEVGVAMDAYCEAYALRNQRSFFDRRTEVRISLVYGFADEGLWGLSSQSHYQMEGDLVTLLARLEKSARPGTILTSLPFLEQLSSEDPTLAASLSQERLSIDLKGIGPTEVVVLSSPTQARAS